MANLPNEPADTSQGRRLQDWWRQLPLPYRVNAVLYALGGIGLCLLLVTMLSDDGARQVQVGAGGPVTTVPTTQASVPTTLRAATTSSSVAGGSSTSSGASTSSSPATTRAGGATTTSGGSGGGGATTTRAPDTTAATTTTAATSPTTSRFDCVNSSNPLCGSFSWHPAPAANQPLTINVVPSKTTVARGEEVTFSVTVIDPDHQVGNNCSEVRYSGEGSANGPCSQPPECPPRYGPWTPPAVQPGQYTTVYEFAWATAGAQTATFTFRAWPTDRCLDLDPYWSENVVTIPITVNP